MAMVALAGCVGLFVPTWVVWGDLFDYADRTGAEIAEPGLPVAAILLGAPAVGATLGAIALAAWLGATAAKGVEPSEVSRSQQVAPTLGAIGVALGAGLTVGAVLQWFDLVRYPIEARSPASGNMAKCGYLGLGVAVCGAVTILGHLRGGRRVRS